MYLLFLISSIFYLIQNIAFPLAIFPFFGTPTDLTAAPGYSYGFLCCATECYDVSN